MALTDDEVNKQINHMISFIDQEATEKSAEIDAKAEEEYNIEKAHVIQKERLNIMKFYEKKEKQVELKRKIQSSNIMNQARLQVLTEREKHIKTLMDDTREQLAKIPEDTSLYPELLGLLIVQCLYQLMEPEVVIRVKQNDVGIVNSVLSKATDQYKSVVKKDVKLVVDTENFLPPNTCGGIQVTAAEDRIRINNTLESRMELIAEKVMPAVRVAIFGRNPNRKFDD